MALQRVNLMPPLPLCPASEVWVPGHSPLSMGPSMGHRCQCSLFGALVVLLWHPPSESTYPSIPMSNFAADSVHWFSDSWKLTQVCTVEVEGNVICFP